MPTLVARERCVRHRAQRLAAACLLVLACLLGGPGWAQAPAWQQVLIVSDVDFSGLDSVLVLVSRRPAPETP